MADYNLGTAKGRVVIDYDGSGVEKAKQDIGGVGDKAGATDAQLNKVAGTMAVAGGAIAGGLAVAVNSAADFEKRLSAINAVSGATGAEMDSIRDKALQLGKDTAFSAGESALAMEELIKAGLTVDDVLNGAADATVNLAAAGEVELPAAAELAANAMNQFGLSAENMPKVADAIAGAANASAIGVGDFGQSLSQVGAVANLAGASFEDTATAIALMGNAGIKGSDAGTSLKTMLMNLQPSTKKQSELFRELGIVTEDGSNQFYDAEGRLKSLGEVSGILQKSLEGMTDAQKQAALETMFGSDAIRAAAVLAKDGAEGFDEMATAMGKVTAEEVAEKRLDNLAGVMEELKGSLETLAIEFGSILIPALRNFAEIAVVVANVFLSLPGPIQTLITWLLAGGAAFLLIGAGIIKMVMFVKELRAALAAMQVLSKLSGLMGLIMNPWFLVILAVIALAWLIYKNWDTIKEALIATWEAIKSAFGAVWEWMKATWESFKMHFMESWNRSMEAIKSAWEATWNGIKAFFGAIWGFIVNTAVEIGTRFMEGLSQIWNGIKTAFEATWNAIAAFFSAIWNGIVAAATAVWNLITTLITGYIDMWRTIITTVLNAILAVWNFIWTNVKEGVRIVLALILGIIEWHINAVLRVIHWLGQLGALVRGWFMAAYNGAVSALSALLGFVSGIPGRILGALGNLGSLLFNAGKSIIDGLKRGIEAAIGGVKAVLNSVTGLIPDWKGPAEKDAKLLAPAGKLIMGGLIDSIAGSVPELERLMGNVTATIPATVNQNVVSSPSAAGAGSVRGDTNITVMYPEPEPVSDGLPRTVRNLDFAGALG